ncbi:MAG: response regulator receiver [Gemmatimonadetes bacterium]|nr:response regulator receiver [Gemmatimonadota bacterium]
MTHRILVVDDEPDITALVAYHLARAGYRVSTAATGAEALKAAREERPDLVVLDLMLPGVSGYDVLAEMRTREETRDVGVILLTARREEADRIRGPPGCRRPAPAPVPRRGGGFRPDRRTAGD